MPKFNHSKPFGKVSGEDAAAYWQDGVSFDNKFEPIGNFEDENEEADNDILDHDPPAADKTSDEVASSDSNDELLDYNVMPWQTVKKHVEAAGGTWLNKLEGVEFLRSK